MASLLKRESPLSLSFFQAQKPFSAGKYCGQSFFLLLGISMVTDLGVVKESAAGGQDGYQNRMKNKLVAGFFGGFYFSKRKEKFGDEFWTATRRLIKCNHVKGAIVWLDSRHCWPAHSTASHWGAAISGQYHAITRPLPSFPSGRNVAGRSAASMLPTQPSR